MSSNLTLSIYTFTLKERSSRDSYYDFNEFYRKHFVNEDEVSSQVKQDELYKRFVGMILDEFENKFWLNSEENKGISTRDIEFRPDKSVIEGFILGGNTGYNHSIYEILDNKETVGEFSNTQLASLPYYFKIWTPPNSQVGVIMIQGYSIGSINTLFFNFISSIFKKYKTTFTKEIHIPKDLREKYMKSSAVYKVIYTSTMEDRKARKKFNRAYEDSEGLKVTITVQGFKKRPINNFMKLFGLNKNAIGIDLKELNMADANSYETKLFYEDENGRKAHAKIDNHFEVRPTIILDKKIENTDKTPNLVEIKKFTDDMLKKVKDEINYS